MHHQNQTQPYLRGIDAFNKRVIDKVINDLKHENEHHEGIGSNMNNFAGLTNFGGINDEQVNPGGLGGIMNEDDQSMADTLKNLKYLWEQKF